MENDEVCPRCGNEDMRYPALSRSDNYTHVCSPCGLWEAAYQFKHKGELPPISEGKPEEASFS